MINYFAEPCLTHGGEVELDKCLSDNDCANGTVCSTRYGDCESACEPGAEACIMACAGRCVEEREQSVCGDGMCDADEVNYRPGNDSGLTYCPGDCGRDETSCDDRREAFDTLAANSASCTRDSDCVIFEASCPYLTCGVAVNASARSRLQSSADAYFTCVEQSGGPVACADCMGMTPRCVNNRCMANLR